MSGSLDDFFDTVEDLTDFDLPMIVVAMMPSNRKLSVWMANVSDPGTVHALGACANESLARVLSAMEDDDTP